MRLRERLLAILVVVGAIAAVVGAPVAPPAAAAPAPLRLISQLNGFNVGPDAFISIIVEVPAGLSLDGLPDADVIITSYAPVMSRGELLGVIDGVLPRAVDTVDLPLASLGRPSPRQLVITIPTESDERTGPALQLPQAGVYPLVVDIRSAGEVLAELVTFVHRLPGADEPESEPINVAFALSADQPVTIDATGRPTLSAAGRAELEQLAEVLDATSMPVAVYVQPQALVALQRDDPELADRLLGALGAHEVIAETLLPLDPSSAVAAGQQALYTQWLRDGEDLFADLRLISRRTLSFSSVQISRPAATLLRDLGSRLLVLTPEVYDTTSGTLGGFTDSTQLVRTVLDGGAELDAAIIDRSLDEVLAPGRFDPELDAIRVAAELLTVRQQVADFGGDPRRHSVVLAAPRLGLPGTEVMASATRLLTVTPGLRITTLDDVGPRTDILLLDGQEVRIGLPETAGTDISDRIATANDLRIDASITGSMLPVTDPRPAQWEERIARLPSTALPADQAEVIDIATSAELAQIRAAVVPPAPFAFTLTGRSSAIRLRFRNTSTTELTVRIRMASAKLAFPDGDQLATLAPDTVTEVEVAVEARSNGRFPVSLEVFAPLGDVDIVPPVPLTARVNALTGLGNVITGAAVLVLLAWWLRHFQRARHRKRAAGAARRHPLSGAPPAGDPPRSPDAETSTLPTS